MSQAKITAVVGVTTMPSGGLTLTGIKGGVSYHGELAQADSRTEIMTTAETWVKPARGYHLAIRVLNGWTDDSVIGFAANVWCMWDNPRAHSSP